MMISSVMFAGTGRPAMARDAAFAVVMIALNGMIGLSLLLGGLRYHEQEYNLRGANAFLAAIVPLLVLTLVLPNFTVASPGPRFSPFSGDFHYRDVAGALWCVPHNANRATPGVFHGAEICSDTAGPACARTF